MEVFGGFLLAGLLVFYVFLAALLRVAGREDDRSSELWRALEEVDEGESGASQSR
ncbi:MAG: hypothetical protein FWJ74_03220 [Gemmatimonadota bacterium]